MRKKLSDEEKKVSFGLSLDPELLEVIKTYTTNNNLKISRFIESILREKLIKNNENDK